MKSARKVTCCAKKRLKRDSPSNGRLFRETAGQLSVYVTTVNLDILQETIYIPGMWMIGRIIYRGLKSFLRVLLVGWTPGPAPDFEGRLLAVERKAEMVRQKVYRDGKAEEAAAESAIVSSVSTGEGGQGALPTSYGPGFHPSGRPIQNGDPVQGE